MAAHLEAIGIAKYYGAVCALQDASITIAPGSVHGLIGENGAGKSTLMRVLAGIEAPDAGEIRTVGADARVNAIRCAIVPQYPRMAASVPMWQNLLLGAEPRWGPFFHRRQARTVLNETAARYGISLNIDAPAGHLNGTEIRLAALLAAIVRTPDLLILDEPTVGLAHTDQEAILTTLAALSDAGIGILYISHDLAEVSRVSDRVTVLAHGASVAQLDGPVTPDQLADAMLGATSAEYVADTAWRNDRTDTFKPTGFEDGIRCEDVLIADPAGGRTVGPLSMTAPSGRITAITGVRESGLDLVEAYLSGETAARAGSVHVDGNRLSARIDPAELRRKGLVFVPSDRFQVAAALDGSVEDNAILRERAEVHPGGIRTTRQSKGVTHALLSRFGISASRQIPLGSLSGGTIQKLILARELERPTPGCVIAEPFAGLDIPSQKMLADMLREIATNGSAVLVLSSTVESVMAVADDIYVLAGGELGGPYPPHATAEINRAVAGLTATGAGGAR
ncbi:MAG: ATP-binding cassette domain-containing protein [Spirochaeta sp.]|nr:ATP-binding cassette domain-containing protein [Spirochaeta sp.]